jgi:hypothetical protein
MYGLNVVLYGQQYAVFPETICMCGITTLNEDFVEKDGVTIGSSLAPGL